MAISQDMMRRILGNRAGHAQQNPLTYVPGNQNPSFTPNYAQPGTISHAIRQWKIFHPDEPVPARMQEQLNNEINRAMEAQAYARRLAEQARQRGLQEEAERQRQMAERISNMIAQEGGSGVAGTMPELMPAFEQARVAQIMQDVGSGVLRPEQVTHEVLQSKPLEQYVEQHYAKPEQQQSFVDFHDMNPAMQVNSNIRQGFINRQKSYEDINPAIMRFLNERQKPVMTQDTQMSRQFLENPAAMQALQSIMPSYLAMRHQINQGAEGEQPRYFTKPQRKDRFKHVMSNFAPQNFQAGLDPNAQYLPYHLRRNT